jgi:hypothetical protein
VAAAIVRAIERNRAEVDAAPLSLRAGARAAGVAPVIAANVTKRFGASIARAVEQGREGAPLAGGETDREGAPLAGGVTDRDGEPDRAADAPGGAAATDRHEPA